MKSLTCIVRLAIALVVLNTFALASLAQKSPAPSAPPPTAGAGGDENVLNFLQSTIVDAEYNRIDLEKIIDDLRQKHNLNIHVSWTALEAAGIRRDLRIEVRLKQVSLATLLEIVLREAGASGKDVPTYHVQDGVLIIALGEAGREDTILRTYDIADLVESGYAIRRFANTPVLGMRVTGHEFFGGEVRKDAEKMPDAGGRGVFGDPKGEPERATSMERAQAVIDLVTETIDPTTWEVTGGSLGSIRLFGSTLLIGHTMRTHQRIAEFFSLLRNTRPDVLDSDAMVVRLRSDKAAAWRKQIGPAFPRLSAAQTGELAQASDAGGVVFRGSTSGFNGQGMLFSALTQRDVLIGSSAIVAQQSSAYMPLSGMATSGLELIVLPLISPRSEEMTIDVQMAWIPNVQVNARAVTLGPEPSAGAASPAGGAAAAQSSSIDQSTLSMRTVSSTTKVKLGEAIALSVPAELNPEGKSVEWEDWLIVRVHRPGA